MKIKSFFLTFRKPILFIIATVFIVIYCKKKSDHTEKNGVITVAKVLRYEAAESGGDLITEVYLRNKVIEVSAGSSCYFCTGRYYFIKVLEDDPESFPHLYLNKPVPDCILENIKYYPGWSDFPACDDIEIKRQEF